MIQSFADKTTAALFAGLEVRRMPRELQQRAAEKLALLNIEDLATIDFSELTTGSQLRPVPPGDILLHDFMEPLGLSANALAKALYVPTNRITSILIAARGISADTALRLARYFGTTPQFWVNLQSNYDLRVAEAKAGSRIRHQSSQCSTVVV